MKFLLRALTFLTSCCGMSIAAVGDTLNPMSGFVAEGVAGTFNENGQFSFSATTSSRFYDSTKGWVSTGDYTGDSAMCWAHTSANMIQYWQTYYGVFYKGNTILPYGTDYERTISGSFSSKTIADPMRLNVYRTFYNGWRNSGGTIENGTNWYFTWQDAGYFKEYFGAYDYNTHTQPNTSTVTDVTGSGTSGLAEALLPAMGISRQADGSYVQSEAGLIAHINIAYDTTNQAGVATTSNHTLTCYGFTLNEDGSIKSIIYADSDDTTFTQSISDGNKTPGVKQVYVKEVDGKLKMYSDEACTQQWKLNTTNDYYIGAVTQINTPEVLKKMLAEYCDTANETLYWNGQSDTWKAHTSTTEALPNATSGWDVFIDGENIASEHHGFYHCYATDNQNIRFDTHGAGASLGVQRITVEGTVTPGNISVGEGTGIHLQAGIGASIAGDGAVQVETGGSLMSELALGSRAIHLDNGATFSYALATDTELTNTFETEEGATVQFRNSSTDAISYKLSDMRKASAMVDSLSGSSLIIGEAHDSAGTNLDLSQAYYAAADLTVKDLILWGNSSLDTAYTTVVTGEFSARQVLSNDSATYAMRNVSSTASINDTLDLRSASGITLDSSVNMNFNKLYLNTAPTALTLNPLFINPALTEGDSFDFTLFENISELYFGDVQVYEAEWDAATYFRSDFITPHTRLMFDGNNLYLQGLTYTIPEPGSCTLALLALSALVVRRKRV